MEQMEQPNPKEKRRKEMEKRRNMEATERLNEAALINRATALYKKYIKTDIPADEAGAFQKLAKTSLTELTPLDEAGYQEGGRRRKQWIVRTAEGEFVEDDRRFKDFRQTVGAAALLGKFKMAGQDLGVKFFRLFFGDQDAGTFIDVTFLAKEVGYRLNRYSLTDMKNVYLFVAAKIELGETFSTDAHKALSRLGSFLVAKGADADKEQLFIEQAVLNQVDLQKKLEEKLGKSASPDQVRARIVVNQEQANRLWTKLGTTSLDQVATLGLVNQILSLAAENSALQPFEASGVSGISFPSVPPALFASRARAGAYQAMASDKFRQAEGLPANSFAAIELAKRAKQYEQAATELWQAGQKVPSTQEVTHG